MNWGNFFSWHYWFAVQPGVASKILLEILIILVVGCFLAAVVFHYVARAKKEDPVTVRILKKLNGLFSFLTFVGVFILLFFWQQVPYLSSRFWLVVWFLLVVVWVGFIIRYALFVAPKRRARLEEEKKYKQYLPTKKK